MNALRYIVVTGYSPDDLAASVKAEIDNGWKPQGGVAVVRWDYEDRKGYADTYYQYAQAMVKDGT